MRPLIGPPLDDVFTRRSGLAAGMTRSEIAWALRSGELLRLRRGVYCKRSTLDDADERGRYLLHCRAAALAHDDRHVVSHLSAAVSWGLPAPLEGFGRPTLTLPGAPASTDRQPDLVVQVAELRAQDVVRWGSARRTSIERSVVDCLRHLPLPDAVAIGDAALHARQVTGPGLHRTLTWQSGWPYAEHGRRALKMLDGRRESPLESSSFVLLYLHGIALPLSQALVFDEDGTQVARCDGWWPGYATVCEADGREKYPLRDWPDLAVADSHDLVDAQVSAARRAVIREKVREDRLRSLGLEVVRWGTFDIQHRLTEVVADIRRAWSRGRPDRVTARLVQAAAPDLPLAVERTW